MSAAVIDILLSNAQQYFMSNETPVLLRTERRRFTYSEILVITVQLGDQKKKLFIKKPTTGSHDIKIQRLTNEFQILQRLFCHFADSPTLGVPRPVGLFIDQEAIVTEEWGGVTLDKVMSRCARHLASNFRVLEIACRRSGEWLKIFHDLTYKSEGVLEKIGLIDYCKVRLDYLAKQGHSGLGPNQAHAIKNAIERLVDEADSEQVVIAGCHNDFSFNNILVDAGKIGVIDFTMYDYQPVYYDVFSFSTKIELMKLDPQFSPRRLAKLNDVFLTAYGIDLGRETPLMTAVRYRYMLSRMTNLLEPTRGAYARIVQKRMYRHCLDWVCSRAGLGGGSRTGIAE